MMNVLHPSCDRLFADLCKVKKMYYHSDSKLDYAIVIEHHGPAYVAMVTSFKPYT